MLLQCIGSHWDSEKPLLESQICLGAPNFSEISMKLHASSSPRMYLKMQVYIFTMLIQAKISLTNIAISQYTHTLDVLGSS